MTDITELAQREKFEAWWEREYKHLESSKYTDAVPHIKYGFWMAYQAGGAELVEALENSESRLHEVAVACATAEQALEKAQQRNAELEAQNEYIRKRYQQLDLLIGKNILVMQAAIIEWQATGDAKNGLAWIYNTLFGPGELPDEEEKDAQAYFDRKYAPLDEELMALHKWFWEQSEAERAAAGIKVEAE